MIKCEITIDTAKNGDLILQASMPEVKEAPELEHAIATSLQKVITIWQEAMSVHGDLTCMEGHGAGAKAIRNMLEKEGDYSGR